MVDINWTGIDLSGDPRLIVGRRPRPKHLEAERVDVHLDAHPALREIAETAVQELADTQPRVYEPFAELEIGEEHFELQVGVGVAGAEDGAELPQLMSVVDELSSVDARDLKDQSNLLRAVLDLRCRRHRVRSADRPSPGAPARQALLPVRRRA